MLIQTWAIFVDAYRELNSKKLFWITLVLSGLVVLIYAAIGIDRTSPTFLWMHLRFIPITSETFPPALLYKLVFVQLGLGLWLTWIATILALISTAPIFPDMIASGAIETVLSKPIGRWRLFLTKYAAGLLFVALQVAVFTGACFLVIGIRGGAWEPGLFLAVPIVVVFFSYLFAVCAVVGLLTRSTIASLLLTILFWFFLYLLNMADALLVTFREQSEAAIQQRTAQIERMEQGTARAVIAQMREGGQEVAEGYVPTREQIDGANPFIASMRTQNAEDEEGLEQLRWWSGVLVSAKTPLPKTSETIALLSRTLIDYAALDAAEEASSEADTERRAASGLPARGARRDGGGGDGGVESGTGGEAALDRQEIAEAGARGARDEFRSRSVWWVMGTSLAFEAAVLGFGAWRFSRRDF